MPIPLLAGAAFAPNALGWGALGAGAVGATALGAAAMGQNKRNDPSNPNSLDGDYSGYLQNNSPFQGYSDPSGNMQGEFNQPFSQTKQDIDWQYERAKKDAVDLGTWATGLKRQALRDTGEQEYYSQLGLQRENNLAQRQVTGMQLKAQQAGQMLDAYLNRLQNNQQFVLGAAKSVY